MGDPVQAGRLDYTTFSGPFQSHPFCDCVTRELQAWLSPSGCSRLGWKSERKKETGNQQRCSPGQDRACRMCILRREVPPKPVTLLRLHRHQFAYWDTSESLHSAHLGAWLCCQPPTLILQPPATESTRASGDTAS